MIRPQANSNPADWFKWPGCRLFLQTSNFDSYKGLKSKDPIFKSSKNLKLLKKHIKNHKGYDIDLRKLYVYDVCINLNAF